MSDIVKFEADKVTEIQEAAFDIPFGNSRFQIEEMICNEETPERAYRKVLLQLNQKLKALSEAKHRRQRTNVDLAEIGYKLGKIIDNDFERNRLCIDMEEKEEQLLDEEKFINDALQECAIYYKVFQSLPKITREEFERGEFPYWEKRLTGDAISEISARGVMDIGTLKELKKIGIQPKKEGNKIKFLVQGKEGGNGKLE